MQFRVWLENDILHNVREATPEEIPRLFIHTTNDPKNVENILKNGFNLNKFGSTAIRVRAPEYLTQYDPKGIYALEWSPDLEMHETRPFVVFGASIQKALISQGKEALWVMYHAKNSSDLRSKLLKQGYQAVLRPGSEQIILDPKIIRIIRTGNAQIVS